MRIHREKWQQRYPHQRVFKPNWRILLALIVALQAIFHPFLNQSAVVQAEENKRVTIKTRETLANHWRFSRWNDSVTVCDIYVTHDNYPSGDDILAYCGEKIYLTWLSTPACEDALFGRDASLCDGIYIGYLGKNLYEVKETVELPQVKIRVETVNCEPGGWCNERVIMKFIGEEPLADHKIIKMHVRIGATEKKCDAADCELRMPITNDQGVEVEYWAISDFGDESEHATFRLRNVPDKDETYRFDLIGAGIDSRTPAGSELWNLFPILNHPAGIVFERPFSIDNLRTKNRFLYLAGKLILSGVVDGRTCSGFGLLDNNTANPCGERLASSKVLEWQNQYDQDIFTASIKNNIPARLLKGIIAQETQFWPHPASPQEFGLGRITENGADMLLNWNIPVYLEDCLSLYSAENCSAGYSNLDPSEQSMLRGLVISDVGTDKELDLLAATLFSSSKQVNQMVKNITGKPVSEVSTYEDMWLITVANYHGGSGCVGTAMQTAWANGDDMLWEYIYPNLLGDCMGAAGYVESVLQLAK
ncbi:MAG: hypothetical protein Q7U53_11900 [Anaerolineaceae bacterium]|nr:hypothetical protein [Anaerolineaceae bacterium]